MQKKDLWSDYSEDRKFHIADWIIECVSKNVNLCFCDDTFLHNEVTPVLKELRSRGLVGLADHQLVLTKLGYKLSDSGVGYKYYSLNNGSLDLLDNLLWIVNSNQLLSTKSKNESHQRTVENALMMDYIISSEGIFKLTEKGFRVYVSGLGHREFEKQFRDSKILTINNSYSNIKGSQIGDYNSKKELINLVSFNNNFKQIVGILFIVIIIIFVIYYFGIRHTIK